MNLRTAFVFSLAIAMPLIAQVEEKTPPSAQTPPRLEEAATKASEPARRLRLITDTVSQNFIPKYTDGAGTLANSGIYEDAAGLVGIGTAVPFQKLHVFANSDAGTIVQVENTNTGSGAHAAFRTMSSLSSTSYVAHGDRPSTLVRFGIPLAGWGELLNYNGNGYIIGTNLNTPLVFGTNNAERMRILGDGNVGIGTATPSGKLGVRNETANGTGLYVKQASPVVSTGQNDSGFVSTVTQSVPTGVTALGMIGGRSEAWQTGLGTVDWVTGGYFQAGNSGTGTVVHAYGVQAQVTALAGTIIDGLGVYVGDVQAVNDYAFYQVAANDTNYFAGNVVVGGPPTVTSPYALSVQGNANFNGTVTGTNIKAHYQDVAEWVPATTDLTPGTVVILNRGRSNEVMASATAYDTTVAGVVSAQPGLSLGIEGEGKEQIATTGRVKVRVDARVKPILVGDLLVTSDTPGTAMRSEPMSINGRPFHQPGTIIGKALEPLEGGVGEILVLLSMQ